MDLAVPITGLYAGDPELAVAIRRYGSWRERNGASAKNPLRGPGAVGTVAGFLAAALMLIKHSLA
jgi:hypothetical protein